MEKVFQGVVIGSCTSKNLEVTSSFCNMEVNNNLDKNSFNGTGDEMYHKIGLRENGKKKKLDTKSIINSNNN